MGQRDKKLFKFYKTCGYKENTEEDVKIWKRKNFFSE